ncbi:MAG: hypothetical protein H7101_07915 [Deinococcales bacterium]|nr:hypothetical protein [Chitinophagaceae bacterium]
MSSLSVGETLQEPINQYYIRLKEKLKAFRIIEKNGGYPLVVTAKKSLMLGDTDLCLIQVKQQFFLQVI